jgi:hypothetical protein
VVIVYTAWKLWRDSLVSIRAARGATPGG